MVLDNLIDIIKCEYKAGEPIFLKNIDMPGYSNDELCNALQKLCTLGKLQLFEPGVYYWTEKNFLGNLIGLDVESYICGKYIKDKNRVFGFYGGLNLENLIGISTQIPFIDTIVSNLADQGKQMITVTDKISIWLCPAAVSVRIDEDNLQLHRAVEIFRTRSQVDLNPMERENLNKFLQGNYLTFDAIKDFAEKYPTQETPTLMRNISAYRQRFGS